jgi:hypothetical protein
LFKSQCFVLLFITEPEIKKKQKAEQYKSYDRILIRLHTQFY